MTARVTRSRSVANEQKSMATKSIKKAQTYNGDLAHLPSALRPLTSAKIFAGWSWQRRMRPGRRHKWVKVPLQADTLTAASADDPGTWATYERALRIWQAGDADGIGFMLLGANIGSIEITKCCERDSNTNRTKIDRFTRALCEEAGDVYWELTPSGNGVRLLGTATGPEVRRSFLVDDSPEEPRIIILRHTARFIALSGLPLKDCKRLSSLDPLIDGFLAKFGGL
jgi:primase-polymerase (primpol)-like protein